MFRWIYWGSFCKWSVSVMLSSTVVYYVMYFCSLFWHFCGSFLFLDRSSSLCQNPLWRHWIRLWLKFWRYLLWFGCFCFVLFKRQSVDFWTLAFSYRSMHQLICSTRHSVIRCMWPSLKCWGTLYTTWKVNC